MHLFQTYENLYYIKHITLEIRFATFYNFKQVSH